MTGRSASPLQDPLFRQRERVLCKKIVMLFVVGLFAVFSYAGGCSKSSPSEPPSLPPTIPTRLFTNPVSSDPGVIDVRLPDPWVKGRSYEIRIRIRSTQVRVSTHFVFRNEHGDRLHADPSDGRSAGPGANFFDIKGMTLTGSGERIDSVELYLTEPPGAPEVAEVFVFHPDIEFLP